MILLGVFRRRQHQANGAALKERERRRRLEQQRQPQHIAMKLHGAVDVVDDIGDLRDFRQSGGGHCGLPGK